jgi:O-antigen/teichoic acid export membrane protein
LQKKFLGALFLMMLLNVLVKPVWIFGIDRGVQNITGFADYGRYFAYLNFCMVLGFILDPGLHIHLSRLASLPDADRTRLFWDGLYAKIGLFILYMAVMVAAAGVAGYEDLGFLFTLMFLHSSVSLFAFFRLFITSGQRFRADGLLSVTDKTVVTLVIGTMMLWPGRFGGITIGKFVAAQTMGITLSILLAVIFLFRGGWPFTFHPFRGFRRDLLFPSIPFALNIFLMTVILRADGILLERIHPDGAREAGLYASGFRILDAFGMMGTLAGGFLLPFIARHWPDTSRFSQAVGVSRRALMCAAILIASVGLAIPGWLTEFLYHRSDAPIINLMRIILLALPGLSLVAIHGTLLTATGHIRRFIHVSAVAAVLSFCLNFWLIPRFGAQASALIAVGIQSIYAFALIRSTHRLNGIGLPLSEFLAYLFVGLMGYGTTKTLAHLGVPVPVSVGLSVALTSVLFYFTLGFRISDLRRMLSRD